MGPFGFYPLFSVGSLLVTLRCWWRPEADVDQIVAVVIQATKDARERYEQATAEAERAAAEHRAASIRLGRLEGHYAALVAQGWCKRDAIRDHVARRN